MTKERFLEWQKSIQTKEDKVSALLGDVLVERNQENLNHWRLERASLMVLYQYFYAEVSQDFIEQ